ncbi:MAG: PAS domain S-box protein, partial [Armatimonadota bacterium]
MTEVEDLRARLAEAEEVLRAIRNGEVDAVVVTGEGGDQVYTLQGTGDVFRQLIETMSEGAATLSADGTILYCNACLAQILGRPLDKVIGASLPEFLLDEDRQALEAILAQARTRPCRREICLQTGEGTPFPVYLAASRLQGENAEGTFCVVLTDLREHKRNEQVVADERLARSILDQAAEAIIVCNEQSLILRASEAAHRFCEGSPLLRPFAEVFPLQAGASNPF